MTSSASRNDGTRQCYKFSVAIDMGAKNTGIFLVAHKIGESPTAENCRAATIVLPDEGDKLVYSTKNRTATRHRLRGYKRYNLARRLLRLIISDALTQSGIDLNPEESRKLWEALFGLLKRRGYSWLTNETDLTPLESLDASVFANCDELGLNEFFSEADNLAEQWEQRSQDQNFRNRFLERYSGENLKQVHKKFADYVKREYPEFKPKDYASGLKLLIGSADQMKEQSQEGQRHRTKYLEEIREDMERDSRLAPAVKAIGSVEKLWHLVGNISNLQLRANRWYFNAPEMLTGDRWQPERLQKTIVRAFRYFHPATPKEAEAVRCVIDEIEKTPDIVEALCKIDPHSTIPPYEDQNNRRPPLDQTLLLNPVELNRRFGRTWTAWSNGFEKKDPVLAGNLDEILSHADRKSRLPRKGKVVPPMADYRSAYILQRVLDRSKARDPYSLRLLVRSDSQKHPEAEQNLGLAVGIQHVERFLQFAADYYREVSDAKSGLWLPRENNLLERSDIHPPMKKKCLDLLIGNVFGMNERFGKTFRETFWNKTIGEGRRTTVRSSCELIEKIRKNYGNEFQVSYRWAIKKKEDWIKDEERWKRFKGRDGFSKPEKPEKETEALWKIHDRIEVLRTFFLRENLPEAATDRICNPYSLAQLYTLIETERDGFTSTTLAAHLENHWRMTTGNGQTGAQCSRLPADAVRPFDGVLRKVLQRQAHELMKVCSEEIQRKVTSKNTDIDLSLIIEENRFAFSSSLADLKKIRRKDGGKTIVSGTDWQNKRERIRQASRGICPYTGNPLAENGEYDHIIPRSLTTSLSGTVFNSEANLIYVSRSGNAAKADMIYSLKDLSKNYLEKVFHTANVEEIESHIVEAVFRLKKTGSLGYFDILSEKDQDLVRHALFLGQESQSRKDVLDTLQTMNRTRVNGTQAWFIRSFMEKLSSSMKNWCDQTGNTIRFRSFKVSADEGQCIRSALRDVNREFEKREIQPVASHSVDALCAYAAACGLNSSYIDGDGKFSDPEHLAESELPKLHPKECEIIRAVSIDSMDKKNPDSRQIFKEGIYGMHFLPIHVRGKEVFIGFTLPDAQGGTGGNSFRVTGKEPLVLLKILAPYLEQPFDESGAILQTLRLNKNKAVALMNKASQHLEPLTQNESLALGGVRALMYTTQRIALPQFFLSAKKGEEGKLPGLKYFTIKCKYSIQKLCSINGSVMLPSRLDWEKLTENPEWLEKWNRKLKDEDAHELTAWLRKYQKMNSSHLRHTAFKRVPSLTVLKNPSGGFIISRTSLDGRTVHQVYETSMDKLAGFKRSGIKADFKCELINPKLIGQNLISVDFEKPFLNSDIGMKSWREIYRNEKEEPLIVSMAPGSGGRSHIRICVSFEVFKNWFDEESSYQSVFDIPSNIKVDPGIFEKNLPKLSKLLGKPRSNLFIEHLGTMVRFRYIAERRSASMECAYNQAVDGLSS